MMLFFALKGKKYNRHLKHAKVKQQSSQQLETYPYLTNDTFSTCHPLPSWDKAMIHSGLMADTYVQ